MEQLCERLITYGHRVTVVTAFPHYERFQVANEYRGKLMEHGWHKGMEVIRLYVYANSKKEQMINRLLSYLSFNFLATMTNILIDTSYDVILCTNGSFFTGVTAHLIGGPKGVPFIYNVQDLYPDVPVKAGQLRNKQAIAVLNRIERFMYKKASHVTVISPSLHRNLLGKGVSREKLSVIPNFVDTSFIRPLPKKNEFSVKHNLTDKFVIAHAGNIGYVYDLEALLDAAKLLIEKKDILFLIIGEGVAKRDLVKKAQKLNLSNVRFLPFQPKEDLPWIRASSDVQVSLYKHGSAADSMPSKVYEIMASGRPLLASADAKSDVSNLIKETGCGICIEPGDPVKLADTIVSLYRDPTKRQTMGHYGRDHAVTSYSRDAVVSRYNDLLYKVVNRRKSMLAYT